RIHADAVLDVFEGGGARKANDTVLGGDVRSNAGVAGQRAHGRIIDNRTAGLTFHLPELVLHAAPYAPQVDPDDAVPVLRAALGNGSYTGHHPGVVECGI